MGTNNNPTKENPNYSPEAPDGPFRTLDTVLAGARSTWSFGYRGFNRMQSWTEADFETLCFHDVHVHGIAIAESEHGTGRLMLDVDYILEWLCDDNSSQCKFRIAPADLVFKDIFGLQISIDYAIAKAGICPFAIDGIQRVVRSEHGLSTFQWTIPINWPSGQLSFESPGFDLRIRGEELITESQSLTIEERAGH